MKKYSVIVIVLAFLFSWVIGQEHPKEEASQKQAEHPTEEQSQEHPSATVEGQEHPAEQPQEHEMMLSTQVVTKDNLADVIRRYIADETVKGEGSFIFVDDKTGETLKLVLKKVHDERLAALGDNTYFACADFKAPDGKIYDLDIFMKGKTINDLAPMEVAVHKEEGVERYTWTEVEGIWHKVAIEEKEE